MPPHVGSQGGVTSESELTPQQLRLLSAELAHKVEFAGPSKTQIIPALTKAMMGSNDLTRKVADFTERYGKGSVVPRKREERASLVFDLAKQM